MDLSELEENLFAASDAKVYSLYLKILNYHTFKKKSLSVAVGII